MDRLISKQAVLDVINEAIRTGRFYCGKERTIEEIKAIPSAEPKTGHWIADIDRWGDVITTVNGYRCDKCNAFDSDKDNYCPNCGCRMVEPQESEDK